MPERDPDARPRGVATPDGAAPEPAPRATAVSLGGVPSLAALCERRCRQDPLHEFLAVKLGGSWWRVSYAEFLPLVDAARGGLARLGVDTGDAVAIVAAPRLEWTIACYAAAGLGARSVSIAPARSRDEWRAILADSGARVALAGSEAIAAALDGLRREVPTLAQVVRLARPAPEPGSWHALLETGLRYPVGVVEAPPTLTASLGYPAGAVRGTTVSHQAMLAAAGALQAQLELGPEDSVLVLASEAETFGEAALHAVFATGCRFALSDGADVVADLAAVEPTVVFSSADALARLRDVARPAPARAGFVGRLLRRGRSARATRSVQPSLGGRLRLAVSPTPPSDAVRDLLSAAGVGLIAAAPS